jgi:hypothetical protein
MSASLSENQKSIADRFESCLGVQWRNDSGKWINKIKSYPDKCARVIAEAEDAKKEKRIRTTPAQYAEYIWQTFAD